MGGTGIEIKDVSHVSIGVSDMERSIAFYRDVFGWEQLFDEHMEGEAFEALTGVRGRRGTGMWWADRQPAGRAHALQLHP